MGKKTRKISNVNSNFSNFTPFENAYMWFLVFYTDFKHIYINIAFIIHLLIADNNTNFFTMPYYKNSELRTTF